MEYIRISKHAYHEITFSNCYHFQLHIEDLLDTLCNKSIYSYNVSYFQSFYLQAELFITVSYMHFIAELLLFSITLVMCTREYINIFLITFHFNSFYSQIEMFITISYMHFNHGYRGYRELYIYFYIHTRTGPSHLEDSRSYPNENLL